MSSPVVRALLALIAMTALVALAASFYLGGNTPKTNYAAPLCPCDAATWCPCEPGPFRLDAGDLR